MSRSENEERKESLTCSTPIEQDAETSNRSDDEKRFGRDDLIVGLAVVIQRGRMLACMPTLETWERAGEGKPKKDDDGKKIMSAELRALVEAWYEAIIGVIPCRHWKEVGLYASRYTNPADRFTLRQFFEAWAKFCEQGKARGYESWR